MLSDAYEAYAKTLETVFQYDRRLTVGSSEVGQCARQVFWVKNLGTKKGVKQDPDYVHDWGARIRGTLMERHFWVPALRKMYGNDLMYAGEQQVTWVKGKLSATPDGLITHQKYDALKHLGIRNIGADCFMAEGKTIDPRTNLVEAKETNYYQAQVQLGLVRECTPFKPVYSVLTYTDASFWSEVDEFAIKFDPDVYASAKVRANQIFAAESGRDLKPEGYIAGGKECSFCPFTQACGVIRRNVPYGSAEASPQLVAEMTDRAKAANALELEILRKQAALNEAKQDIKDRLREKGVRRIEGVVTWSSTAAPVRYKNKELREAFVELGGDIEEFTTEGQPGDRLVIAASPAANRKGKKRSVRESAKPNVKPKARKTNGKLQKGKRQAGSTKQRRTGAGNRSSRSGTGTGRGSAKRSPKQGRARTASKR